MEKTQELKGLLVDMLKWFHNFCKENSLRYYIVGGTMLGAARHKGFIPWDDDIDVAMPDADYKKLAELLKDAEGRYVLETPDSSANDYFYSFSKLYDTQTTLVENTKYQVKRGIYLDIFPLVGMGNTEEEGLKKFKNIEKTNNLLISKVTGLRKGRSFLKNAVVALFRFVPLNEKKLLKKLVNSYFENSWDDCLWGGNPVGAWRFKEIMPTEIMGNPTIYTFEGTEVYGVEKYDEYLTHLYGNWRELPPEEKRVSHHDYVYCNLHEGYMNNQKSTEKESFEILCVTMHQKDFSKIKEMNIHSDVVYANQCDKTAYEEYVFENHTAKMISTSTRGVGINRNLALMYASADICLFADDDVTYNDNLQQQVLSEFENCPDADVIIFHLASNHPLRKPPKYSETKKWPKYAGTPWGAVRIAFRLKSIRKSNAWFTTLLGGGCIFPSGEDSMWLKALRKAGLTFYVSKETIGTVSYEESSWFSGFDEKYYYGVGACNAAINLKNADLKYLLTAVRTRNKGDLSIQEKLKWMRNGKKGYEEMLSFEDYKNKYIK